MTCSRFISLLLLLLCLVTLKPAPFAQAKDLDFKLKAPANPINPQTLKPNELLQNVPVKGLIRQFILYTPPKSDPQKTLPVVFVFHGSLMSAAAMRDMTQYEQLADREGFLVVFPQAFVPEPTLKHYITQSNWNVGSLSTSDNADDVSFVKMMLMYLPLLHPIDRSRIYATGLSSGGFFSSRMACDLGDKFAAIAPVSGTIPYGNFLKCKKARAMPVIQIHGTKDPVVPYTGGPVNFPPTPEVVLSVPQTLKLWAEKGHCNFNNPTTTPFPDKAPDDGTSAERIEYPGCQAGIQVQHIRITNGGHTWPGTPYPETLPGLTNQDFSTTELGWQFMKQFSLPQPPSPK